MKPTPHTKRPDAPTRLRLSKFAGGLLVTLVMLAALSALVSACGDQAQPTVPAPAPHTKASGSSDATDLPAPDADGSDSIDSLPDADSYEPAPDADSSESIDSVPDDGDAESAGDPSVEDVTTDDQSTDTQQAESQSPDASTDPSSTTDSNDSSDPTPGYLSPSETNEFCAGGAVCDSTTGLPYFQPGGGLQIPTD